MANGKVVSLQEYRTEREFQGFGRHSLSSIAPQSTEPRNQGKQKSAFDYGDFCSGCGTYRRHDQLVELDDGVEAFPVCPGCVKQFELEECDGCGQKVYHRYGVAGSALCGDCVLDDGDFADDDENWDDEDY